MKNNIKYLVLNTESELTDNALIISNASNPSTQGYSNTSIAISILYRVLNSLNKVFT